MRPPLEAPGATGRTALEIALEVTWPDPVRVALLRACLWDGDRAQEAWREFGREVKDAKRYIERDRTGLKGLLPVVHWAAQRNGFELPPALWTYLRSAALREEVRNDIYRRACGEILQGLSTEGVPVIALKACALAESLYPTPGVRHCHAVDILVPDAAFAKAVGTVTALGFRPARILEALPGARQGFRNASGLPLVVHKSPCDSPIYPIDTAGMWSESQPATVAGASVRALSVPHNLLHVLAAAFFDRSRANLRWCCDAWLLIERMDRTHWIDFVRDARTARLELPVSTMLRFLAGPLQAPVPEETLAALASSVRPPDRLCREGALAGAMTGVTAFFGLWSRMAGQAGLRGELLRFLLWPSGRYILWRFGTGRSPALPLLYAIRPVAYVRERAWARLIKLPVLNRFTRYRRVVTELEKLRA